MKISHLLLILLPVFYGNLFGQGIAIHVSPQGDDRHEGSRERPVATLERARYLARETRQQQESTDTVSIILHEGVYRLTRGIVLTEEDAGTPEAPLVIRSHQEEKVTISGAIPVVHYKPLSKNHPLYRKDPVTGSRIVQINLRKAGLKQFNPLRLSGFNGQEAPKNYSLHELYFEGKPMLLSRWPNKGFTEFADLLTDSAGTIIKMGILYHDPAISAWQDEPNLLLHGYWKYLWAEAYEQVASIDTTSRVIWLTPPYNHYGFLPNHPFAAYNVITGIDQPGEWAYDYLKGMIYFYPPDTISGASLELSVCEDPLLIMNNTAWVTFRDLDFEMGASECVQISGSSHINFDHCRIHGFARAGMVMAGGNSNEIASCEIFDTGRGAIRVSGGNRETLEESGYHIVNCHLHHLSRIDRTYTPGIWVDGTGTWIEHCLIHDVPSSAMRINGNNHLVEYNEMHHVVTESDDQGAIDMWGDPTFRGNVYRYNYIHDVGPYDRDEVNADCGRAGIRFDDAISGNLVYANVFRNCSGGLFGAIQIHGGKENLIVNNLIYQCSAGISFTPWDKERWMAVTKSTRDFFEQHRERYIARYPGLTRIDHNLNVNTVAQNIFLRCKETTMRMPDTVIFQNNIITDEADGILGTDNITAGSRQVDFRPIPVGKIGLLQ